MHFTDILFFTITICNLIAGILRLYLYLYLYDEVLYIFLYSPENKKVIIKTWQEEFKRIIGYCPNIGEPSMRIIDVLYYMIVAKDVFAVFYAFRCLCYNIPRTVISYMSFMLISFFGSLMLQCIYASYVDDLIELYDFEFCTRIYNYNNYSEDMEIANIPDVVQPLLKCCGYTNSSVWNDVDIPTGCCSHPPMGLLDQNCLNISCDVLYYCTNKKSFGRSCKHLFLDYLRKIFNNLYYAMFPWTEGFCYGCAYFSLLRKIHRLRVCGFDDHWVINFDYIRMIRPQVMGWIKMTVGLAFYTAVYAILVYAIAWIGEPYFAHTAYTIILVNPWTVPASRVAEFASNVTTWTSDKKDQILQFFHFTTPLQTEAASASEPTEVPQPATGPASAKPPPKTATTAPQPATVSKPAKPKIKSAAKTKIKSTAKPAKSASNAHQPATASAPKPVTKAPQPASATKPATKAPQPATEPKPAKPTSNSASNAGKPHVKKG